jgi:hypothetical protein
MVEEIDRNTQSNTAYDRYNYPEGPEWDNVTVLRASATLEQISELELRIERVVPEDMKEFLQITNGCAPVKKWRSFREPLLVPVEKVFWTDKAAIDHHYRFILLPDAELGNIKIDWPQITDEVVGMYLKEATGAYVWMIPASADCVQTAKQRLQEAYDAADNKGQSVIDRHIKERYGSKEKFEQMEDVIYCHYRDILEGQRVFTSFRSYLNGVAYGTRPLAERSPLKEKDSNNHSLH